MNTVVKLDKHTRNSLDPGMFAFPRTRSCPLHDEHHVKLAWKTIDAVKDATPEERRTARQLTIGRASDLKIDTKDWNKVKAMKFECMALNIAADDDHPNKMPFSGVLTKLDEPSDSPPGGSGGKRIIVTDAAARAALGSLLGMSVNFTPSFDDHDAKAKIGLITSADIIGNELTISGFIYAADFPDTAELIQALKDVLGFSFEAQRLTVRDMSADILTITELTFTGAAILRKDKAAYQTTSLAANADNGDLNMTPEELKALMGPILTEALKPITDRLATVETNNTQIVASIQANAAIRDKVEPHAVALETQATTMEAAGLKGLADGLRKVAADMRTEASAGRLPAALSVGGEPAPAAGDTALATQIAAAVEAALKPVKDELKVTTDKLTVAETKLKDVGNTTRLNASAPDRKTIPPAVTNLMSRAGIALPEEGKTLPVGEVDKLMAGANLTLSQRIMLKGGLERVGILA